MAEKRENLKGRRLAITIILGVFVAIMICIFVNLLVSYVYEGPEYQKFCPQNMGFESQMAKTIPGTGYITVNCTFDKALNDIAENCSLNGGQPIYEYNNGGCAVSMNKCDMCQKEFDDASKAYNRKVFFVFAIIGFALIIFGLFNTGLLLQIVSLPSGAVLVIESAMRNFDDKLFVVITFGLLIIGALYLAIKKFKLN